MPEGELELGGELQLDYRGRPRSDYQTVNDEPSATIQSDADKADINKILKKYKQVGIMEALRETDAIYMDVTEIGDYAEVMRVVKAAEVYFMKLPSKVREEFGHDVANWLDAAHDQEKRDALVEAGVIEAVETTPKGTPTGSSGGAREGEEGTDTTAGVGTAE